MNSDSQRVCCRDVGIANIFIYVNIINIFNSIIYLIVCINFILIKTIFVV